MTITDATKASSRDMRKKILEKIDQMLGACQGIGKNPFVVNVITFSGHSICSNGDVIFVVPETEASGTHKISRFINVSGLARKFAETKYILNIFIMNTSIIIPKIDKFNQQPSDISMEASE